MFWSTLLAILLAVCVWLIVGSVREYLKYEVATLKREEEDRAPLFPTITICQRFPFNTDTAFDLISRSSAAARVIPETEGEVVRLLEKWSLEQTGSYMNESVKRSLSQLNIINCRIGARACTSSDFQWTWMPKYYGCYRFNSGFNASDHAVPMIRADELADSSTFAFTIELYSGISDQMSDLNSKWLGHLSSRDFYVFVQNASHSPLNPTPSPLTLSASYGVEISLKRFFYSQFNARPYAYSDCRVDEHNEPMGKPLDENDPDAPLLFDQARHSGYAYTRNTCIYLCAQLLTRRACTCDSFDLPPLQKTNNRSGYLCVSVNETACASAFFYGKFMSGDFIKHNCLGKCPLECHSSQLDTHSLRTFNYPSDEDIKRVNNDPVLSASFGHHSDFRVYLKSNLVKFSIGYDSPLSAIRVDERPNILLVELVGTLGGHLNLLLGMSLLSFVELVELAVTVCAHACRGSHEKKDHPPSPSSNDQPAMTSPAAAAAALEAVELEPISSSECQQPTILPPSDIRSNEDVESRIRTTATATVCAHSCRGSEEKEKNNQPEMVSPAAAAASEAATVDAVETEPISSNEDREPTILPPSDARSNENVESGIGTTTATNTGSAIDSASSVSTASNHEMKQQKYDQTLWERLVTSIQQLKIGALSNIFHSHWLAFKVFWLLLLVAFVIMCTALVSRSVAEYFQFEVVSSTRIVTEHTAVFPTLTICPLETFNTNFARSLVAKANGSHILQLEAYAKNTNGSYLTDGDKQRLTDLDAMLTKCNIGSTPCNASNFTWLWHPVRLNCYRFNGDGAITTLVAGEANFAFHLILNSSFYLYVHNADEWPFGASSSQPLLVTEYLGMAVNVQRSFYSQFNAWPYAYSECSVDKNDKLLVDGASSHLFERVPRGVVLGNDADKLFERSKNMSANYKYSRDTCVSFCLQLATTRRCGCTSYNLGIPIDGYEWCLSSVNQTCADDEIILSEKFVEDNCLSKCPLECNRRKLVPQLSAFALNNFEVKVFYDTLTYTITEERAKMTIWDLFGTLGGHLQLFLSMSPLNILEIGEILLLAALWPTLRRRRRRRKVASS